MDVNMEPQQPAVDGDAPNQDNAVVAKNRDSNVVKRPARGYHMFRNGVLNVKPKGGERDLVRANQQSLLLRLPPEIRKAIWMLALGGRLYSVVYKLSGAPFASWEVNRSGIALLRVCRQIYSETARIALRENTFSFWDARDISVYLKILRRRARTDITSLLYQLAIRGKHHTPAGYAQLCVDACEKAGWRELAGVKELIVWIFPLGQLDETFMQPFEHHLREAVEHTVPHLDISVRAELAEWSWMRRYIAFRPYPLEAYSSTEVFDEQL